MEIGTERVLDGRVVDRSSESYSQFLFLFFACKTPPRIFASCGQCCCNVIYLLRKFVVSITTTNFINKQITLQKHFCTEYFLQAPFAELVIKQDPLFTFCSNSLENLTFLAIQCTFNFVHCQKGAIFKRIATKGEESVLLNSQFHERNLQEVLCAKIDTES